MLSLGGGQGEEVSGLGMLACLTAGAVQSVRAHWIPNLLACSCGDSMMVPAMPHPATLSCQPQTWGLEMCPASCGLAQGVKSFRCPKPKEVMPYASFCQIEILALLVGTAERPQGNAQACADSGLRSVVSAMFQPHRICNTSVGCSCLPPMPPGV